MGKGKRYISPQQVERLTEPLIEQFGVVRPPVPVESIAGELGLTVEYTSLGAGISGLLVVSRGTATIGINKRDPRVRQRFTIAHEIGHFRLHARRSNDVFIDTEYTLFRDNRASRGEVRDEIQANLFAASLLMPASLLRRRIEQGEIDVADDVQVTSLAYAFEVSLSAMAYRLMRLFR